MEPTLSQGEQLVVDTFRGRWLHLIRRGDMIVFECPRQHDHVLVKRVIGLGGDRVEIRKGRVCVNDQLLWEPYSAGRGDYDWGPGIVPTGQLFVLSDNRNSVSDSHVWGYLPGNNIIGKVRVQSEKGYIQILRSSKRRAATLARERWEAAPGNAES